jgi:hypothetical protein
MEIILTLMYESNNSIIPDTPYVHVPTTGRVKSIWKYKKDERGEYVHDMMPWKFPRLKDYGLGQQLEVKLSSSSSSSYYPLPLEVSRWICRPICCVDMGYNCNYYPNHTIVVRGCLACGCLTVAAINYNLRLILRL